MEIIDDKYWLNYGKQGVTNSITTQNEGAAKLERMILWFWAIYTTSFTIGVSANLIEAPTWILILLSLPIVTLIIAYWLCIWTQLPVITKFDPRIPYEIRQGYNSTVNEKNRRFKLTLTATLVSAIILAFALFSLSFFDKKQTTSVTSFFDNQKKLIIVSGTFPKNTMLTTTLDSLNEENHKVQFYSNIYKVQDNGVFNVNIPVDTKSDSIIVAVTWKDGTEEKGHIQILKK